MTNEKQKGSVASSTGKLGLFALAAIVVSSMLGGGVFSLPQNTAQSSAVGPIIIAWLIAGVGVYFIANSFRILSDIRPDLKAGVYMYAREGFGKFIGFIVAWGYWIMTAFGNVAFAVILMDSFNYFFPGDFTGGNNLTSIICGSVLIWAYNFLVLSGTKVAGSLNAIGTIAKLVPIAIFVFVLAYAMNYVQLTTDFWGSATHNGERVLGSLSHQIVTPMIVALWCFVGVEGAVVLSGRAKNESDVGKATLLGFIVALAIYILLSVLPFGISSQESLAAVANPSTAGVLGMVVGSWGDWLMNIGLIVSVIVSWLAWTMLCAELPMVAAQNGTFPKAFTKVNDNGAASVSLWVSSGIMQAALLLVYFANNAWNTMYTITTLMVLPAYLSTTLYLFKVCADNEYSKYAKKGRDMALFSGVVGFIFCLFMFYAGGLNYAILVPLLLTLGVPLFIWSRKEQREAGDQSPIFEEKEIFYLSFLFILDIIGIGLYALDIVTL